jgi:hypothetical protein
MLAQVVTRSLVLVVTLVVSLILSSHVKRVFVMIIHLMQSLTDAERADVMARWNSMIQW